MGVGRGGRSEWSWSQMLMHTPGRCRFRCRCRIQRRCRASGAVAMRRHKHAWLSAERLSVVTATCSGVSPSRFCGMARILSMLGPT